MSYHGCASIFYWVVLRLYKLGVSSGETGSKSELTAAYVCFFQAVDYVGMFARS